jgi:hypothetical protein
MFPPHSSVANVYGNSRGNRAEKMDMADKVTGKKLKQEFDTLSILNHARDEYDQVTNIPEEQWVAIISDGHPYADEA